MDAGVQSRDRDERQQKRDVHDPARRRVDPHEVAARDLRIPARWRYRMLVAMAPMPAGAIRFVNAAELHDGRPAEGDGSVRLPSVRSWP